MDFVDVINNRCTVNYFAPVKRLLYIFTKYEIRNTLS